MFYLRDPETDDFYEIKPSTVVGRFNGDICFPDDSQISKKHCKLEVFENALRITDLGSTNGTYVGEKRLEVNTPQIIAPGNTITIGRQTLTVGILDSEVEPADKGAHEISRTVTDIDEHETPEPDEVRSIQSSIETDEAIDNENLSTDSPPNDLDDDILVDDDDEPAKKITTKGPLNKIPPLKLIFGFLVAWIGGGILFSGSMQMGLKYPPYSMWLLEIVGLVLTFILLQQPILLWFEKKPKSPLSIGAAIFISIGLCSFIVNLGGQLMNHSMQKKVNLIYSSCIKRKNADLCETRIRACQSCLQNLNQRETIMIEKLLTDTEM